MRSQATTGGLAGRRLLASLLVIPVLLATVIPQTPAHAVTLDTPPDSCFQIDGLGFTTPGTITKYYATEGNVVGAPACPKAISIPTVIQGKSITTIGSYAFYFLGMTAVAIPDGVTSIQAGGFIGNDITDVTLPSTLTSIGMFAFAGNQLATISLPGGLQSIDMMAFAENKLTDVTLPASVQTLGQWVFFGQNPWGGGIENDGDPTHYLFSSDPAVVQHVYDSVWYVKVYTADPSNPHGFTSDAMSENDYGMGDGNNNGTGRDSLGGMVINPITVTFRYSDENGNTVRPDDVAVGKRTSDGAFLTDYSVKASGILAPVGGNPQQVAEMQAGFAQYYRYGQNAFVAPTLAGYTLVGTHAGGGSNTWSVTYTYRANPVTTSPSTDPVTPPTPTPTPSGGLADTGSPVAPALMIGVAMLVIGSGVVLLQRRRH